MANTVPSELCPLGTKFQSNTSLTSFNELFLFKGLTGYGTGAFSGCTYLLSVKLPATPTTLGYTMFSGCTRLNNVLVPEGVHVINTGCFQNCKALVTLDLPSTTTSLYGSCFNAATALATLIVRATTPPTIANTLLNNTCKIYVPSASVDAYKTAWSSLASRIYAI